MRSIRHGSRDLSRRIFLAGLAAGILPFLLSCNDQTKIQPQGPPPNVIIVLVDALRADQLGAYGSRLGTSPFFDSRCKQGVLFKRAYAQASHTKISVASLFTGLIPPSNGVRKAASVEEIFASEGLVSSDVLAPDLTTMAEAFFRRGYATAAVITNPHLLATMGFDQGFRDYIYLPGDARAKLTNQTALDWLSRRAQQPFFLYVHYMDVHGPYHPQPPYDEMFTMGLSKMEALWQNGPAAGPVTEAQVLYSRGLYDGQIRYWDDQFKIFYQELEDRGLLHNTILVIIADHGEEFYEHGGFGHGFTVYDEMLHVPLLILWPGVIKEGVVREDDARLIDLFPTLEGMADLEHKGLPLQGRDLFAKGFPGKTWRDLLKKPEPQPPVYAETFQGQAPRCLRFPNQKFIENQSDQSSEFYRLDQDPGEKKKLAIPADPLAKKHESDLRDLSRQAPLAKPGVPVPLDPQTLRALKSMGY